MFWGSCTFFFKFRMKLYYFKKGEVSKKLLISSKSHKKLLTKLINISNIFSMPGMRENVHEYGIIYIYEYFLFIITITKLHTSNVQRFKIQGPARLA